MIHEVDEALRSFVRQGALPGTSVDVVFDAPTKDWSSRRNAPTVDMYLYDIREDLRRREFGTWIERASDGRPVAQTFPPRWYKLSYLVTAWTQRPEDEHRLLAALMQCFLQRNSLPANVLTGSLAELKLPVSYTCAIPPPQDRALSDVWSALGGELKPSLDLVLLAPFDIEKKVDLAPPVEAPLDLSLSDSKDGGSDVRRGRPVHNGSGAGGDANGSSRRRKPRK